MKINLLDIKTVVKINNLANRLDEIYQDKEAMTQSDFQGAIDAVIIEAMQFNR